MYDCFDNMYQATVGIDFFSKVRGDHDSLHYGFAPTTHELTTGYRPCISKTEQCDFNYGTRLDRSVSVV
jgi:hypothetical protein